MVPGKVYSWMSAPTSASSPSRCAGQICCVYNGLTSSFCVRISIPMSIPVHCTIVRVVLYFVALPSDYTRLRRFQFTFSAVSLLGLCHCSLILGFYCPFLQLLPLNFRRFPPHVTISNPLRPLLLVVKSSLLSHCHDWLHTPLRM